MEVKYKIFYTDLVVDTDIPALPTTAKKRIIKAIEERLQTDPVSYGEHLRSDLKGYKRLRVGDYRIVYRIEEQVVIISAIAHRKDVYEL